MANLSPVPDELSDEQVLMCPDIMSTGFSGAERANIRIGDTVAVFAQGPIGLCATAGAKLRGATTVIGVDRGNGPDLLDPSGLDDLLADTSPDVVYHLAGWSDIGASWKHPRTAFEVNATGTLNLLQACIAHGRPRVLAVSSADVYGTVTPAELPLTENSPFRSASARKRAMARISAAQPNLSARVSAPVPSSSRASITSTGMPDW
jgi:Zn-dependent alcohol dehydrogenase